MTGFPSAALTRQINDPRRSTPGWLSAPRRPRTPRQLEINTWRPLRPWFGRDYFRLIMGMAMPGSWMQLAARLMLLPHNMLPLDHQLLRLSCGPGTEQAAPRPRRMRTATDGRGGVSDKSAGHPR